MRYRARTTLLCGVLICLAADPLCALAETAADAAPVGAESPGDPATQRAQLADGVRQALQAGDYGLARERGTEYVAFLERNFGPDATELIVPLANLAAAMVELNDGPGAHQNLSRALALLDRHPPDRPLVRVRLLTLDGRALTRAREFDKAGSPLQRAAEIAQKDASIDALMRAQVYEAMLDYLVAGGLQTGRSPERWVADGDTAAAREIEALEAYYGADTPELAVALQGPAAWYGISDRWQRQQELDRRAIRLIEKAGGPLDPRLAVPLRSLAGSCLRKHQCKDEAIKAADQALKLEYGNSVAAVNSRAAALALRGDLELIFGRPADSTARYIEAWQFIAQHPDLGTEIANRYFGSVAALFVEPTWSIKHVSTGSRLHENTATVKIQFTVTALGTADDMQVVSAPANTDWADVLRGSVSQIRYRPRVVDGVPVETPSVELNWTFQ